jgi:hypothetical protein
VSTPAVICEDHFGHPPEDVAPPLLGAVVFAGADVPVLGFVVPDDGFEVVFFDVVVFGGLVAFFAFWSFMIFSAPADIELATDAIINMTTEASASVMGVSSLS